MPVRDSPPRTLLLYPSMDASWARIRGGEVEIRRPSLGLQYVMAALDRAGYPFAFRDQVVQGVSADSLVREVARGGIDVVGIHANVMSRDRVRGFIRELKARAPVPVLVGGPGSLEGRIYLDAGADAVCVGEAAPRIVALVDALAANGRLDGIPGVWSRDAAGEVRAPTPVPRLEDLDGLPFPYRPKELVPLYSEPVNPAQRGTYVSLIASRGCPFRCAFCTSHAWWGREVRARSPRNVVDEIESLLGEWTRPYLAFVDDVFGVSASWVSELCELILSRGLRFSWECILHPLSFSSGPEPVLALMRRAGCNCVSFGAQSSSPVILRNVQRSAREPEELAERLRICKKLGMLTIATFIFGLPGEDQGTMEESLSWALRRSPHLADFHPLVVLPHSPIATEYAGREITRLSEREIERKCADAFRRFYFRPATWVTLLRFIVAENPSFLIRVFRPLARLLSLIVSRRPSEPSAS